MKSAADIWEKGITLLQLKDLAGSPGLEVVAGDGLAVAPVQHQPVVVFLGLQMANAISSASNKAKLLKWPYRWLLALIREARPARVGLWRGWNSCGKRCR